MIGHHQIYQICVFFTAVAELFCRGCKILRQVVRILPSHFLVTCYPYKEVHVTAKCDGKIPTCHPLCTPGKIVRPRQCLQWCQTGDRSLPKEETRTPKGFPRQRDRQNSFRISRQSLITPAIKRHHSSFPNVSNHNNSDCIFGTCSVLLQLSYSYFLLFALFHTLLQYTASLNKMPQLPSFFVRFQHTSA